ncbi:hydrogenase maturation nickel metallochaperone HypA [Akkermansia sp. N21116]|jgi:hydrogenase nickel incorporation protein HypA/HybF|uniref:hydrogenase maturation nickel metallochaperone HypA/HybF n=1 Tax=Akkermansia sp. N21116 TaxID=3040764 RepID=UPI00244EC706|nr:hydrogenase maturation nickel metallochaperone HypA [Akkermansia sp. N21116]WPX40713.1 hydrogenase maturation nickel metallochaperone HypA [Akkermansia sp. N21116]
MHEAGIVAGALSMAREIAVGKGGRRITRMVLTVGSLSSVVPEALENAFRALSHGTMAEGASLEVEWVEACCRCSTCGSDFEFAGNGYVCPGCGEPSMVILRGRELELKTVEWI